MKQPNRYGVMASRRTPTDDLQFYLMRESYNEQEGKPEYALGIPGWMSEASAEHLEGSGARLDAVELAPTGTFCVKEGQWWKGVPDVSELSPEVLCRVRGILGRDPSPDSP